MRDRPTADVDYSGVPEHVATTVMHEPRPLLYSADGVPLRRQAGYRPVTRREPDKNVEANRGLGQ